MIGASKGIEALQLKAFPAGQSVTTFSESLVLDVDNLGGPYTCLLLVAHGASSGAQTVATLQSTSSGKWVRRGSKTKSGIGQTTNTTLEMWTGFGIESSPNNFSFQLDFSKTANEVLADLFVFRGASQREDWVSAPFWAYTSNINDIIPLKTPDLVTPASRDTNRSTFDIGFFCAVKYVNTGRAITVDNMQQGSLNTLGNSRLITYQAGVYTETTPINTGQQAQVSQVPATMLALALNVYGPAYWAEKAGTPPELAFDDLTEDEMRYKAQAEQLERDLSDSKAERAQAEADFIATNRALQAERDAALSDRDRVSKRLTKQAADATAARDAAVAERDAIAATLPAEIERAAVNRVATLTLEQSAQIKALQADLATARSEVAALRSQLQEVLDTIPTLLAETSEQHFQQRLNELLADPTAFRKLLMRHAQQANSPTNLFAALNAMDQL